MDTPRIDLAFNLETSDPDDIFTLCILATHPGVHLRAAVVTPGSPAQVGLVKHVLERLDRKDVLVGARTPEYAKTCVSEFHYNWLGDVAPVHTNWLGHEALQHVWANLNSTQGLCLLSGASLGNFQAFFRANAVSVPTMVVQGGFAGDNIMFPEDVLPKFRGKLVCPTFNLGGDRPAAHYLLALPSSRIGVQLYVSKNVCHGLPYDYAMHEEVKPIKDSHAGLAMMYEGMTRYLQKTPRGKLFHDPLAAAVAIDPSVCQFVPVEAYEEKGQWGCVPSAMSNKFISTRVDRTKFKRVLFGLQ